jgi:4-oxalocrotonate tautomerase
MPIIEVKMMDGRTNEQKDRLIHELTNACIRAIDAPIERIQVLIHEIPKQNFGISGKSADKLGR